MRSGSTVGTLGVESMASNYLFGLQRGAEVGPEGYFTNLPLARVSAEEAVPAVLMCAS